MARSLLFIPDISGFTHFVKTTEVEHSQHVIAELLEVLISANTQQLELAEIEGDALFFFKEDAIPSQEKLLAQVESMYTAFYSHLHLLEKHRICPCNACATAPNLQLKIIIHSGDLQFIEVQGNRKPFGEVVIQAHRLLKNSVASQNYVLISKPTVSHLGMAMDYESRLFQFRTLEDSYDDVLIGYAYAEVDVSKLKLMSFQEGVRKEFKCASNLTLEKKMPVSANQLMEYITNYKYRHLWAVGADKIEWNENQVTRLGSEHTCTVGAKQLNFTVITKHGAPGEIVYGEQTTSPPPVDELNQFFIVSPVSEKVSNLRMELFWKARSPIKKIVLFLLVKKAFKNGASESLEALRQLLIKETA